MSTLGEVETAFNTLVNAGAKSVAILHCTSNYPASYDSVNLKAMTLLEKAFNTKIGYSDHTEGNEISVAAVALGAKIIEKHFTLDKNLPGPDHKASIDPQELAMLVKQIRNTEKAIGGSGRKELHASEVGTKKVVTKGIYINQDLKAGDVMSEAVISLKRPASHIPASMFDLVVNKKVKVGIQKGSALKWDQISFE
jgi:sialic acid synthase SpsE